MEHGYIVGALGVLAGIVTAAGNMGFDQGWGIGVFFLIWLIGLVIVYGGVLILDGDPF